MKPACISAAIERACARAAGSRGQNFPGAESARKSPIASDSHTLAPSIERHGTLPVGERAATQVFQSAAPMSWTSSRKSIPAILQASQPRKDHEEYALLPR